MAEYKYRAKDAEGKVITAYVQAGSRNEAIEHISEKGYFPLSVDEISGAAQGKTITISFLEGIMMRRAVTDFSRQLANMIRSGIPVLKGISLISEQCENARFGSVITDVFNQVRDGKSLSQSFSRYPRLFDYFFTAMVRVGEDNGTLPNVLTNLVAYRRKQDEIIAKVKGALTYPLVVCLVGVGTVYYMMTNVLPRLVALIQSMGQELPLVTVMLISVVNMFERYGNTALLVSLVGALIGVQLYRKKNVRLMIDGFRLRVPIFGKLVLDSEIVRFAQTLRESLDAGLSMMLALELATSVIHNMKIRTAIEGAYAPIKSGASLGAQLKETGVIPPLVTGMIVVAEESGHLTEVLGHIADDYEWRVNERIRTMTTLIEPLIMLALGAAVGFIVLSLLLPIFQMDMLAG